MYPNCAIEYLAQISTHAPITTSCLLLSSFLTHNAFLNCFRIVPRWWHVRAQTSATIEQNFLGGFSTQPSSPLSVTLAGETIYERAWKHSGAFAVIVWVNICTCADTKFVLSANQYAAFHSLWATVDLYRYMQYTYQHNKEPHVPFSTFC